MIIFLIPQFLFAKSHCSHIYYTASKSKFGKTGVKNIAQRTCQVTFKF